MIDSPKHKGKRKKLVEELISKGITSKRVLNAIYNIPRHFFIENDFQDFAYEDKAFPISACQTISQPYTVAFQTEKLGIKEGEKILEIGTGSGYQTAILIYLKTEVYSVERIFELKRKAKTTLSKLKLTLPVSPKFPPFLEKIDLISDAVLFLLSVKASTINAVP